MKTAIHSIILATAFLFLAGCSKDKDITPSANVTTVEYNIKGYNQLRVEGSFIVEVNISPDEEKILVEANENLHGLIVVEKNLNELVIRLDNQVNIQGKPTLKAYITTDYLNEFHALGASRITQHDTLNGGSFRVNLSGASIFSGTLMGGDINVRLEGASKTTLTGTADKLNVDALGASVMEGFGMTADWLHAVLEGASMVSVTVNTKLDVWASGASTVYYKGDGVVNTQELSGSSKIIKVD